MIGSNYKTLALLPSGQSTQLLKCSFVAHNAPREMTFSLLWTPLKTTSTTTTTTNTKHNNINNNNKYYNNTTTSTSTSTTTTQQHQRNKTTSTTQQHQQTSATNRFHGDRKGGHTWMFVLCSCHVVLCEMMTCAQFWSEDKNFNSPEVSCHTRY